MRMASWVVPSKGRSSGRRSRRRRRKRRTRRRRRVRATEAQSTLAAPTVNESRCCIECESRWLASVVLTAVLEASRWWVVR
jgi:hypothetical protein